MHPNKPPSISLHLFLKVLENLEAAVEAAKAAPVTLFLGKNASPVAAISQQEAMQSNVKPMPRNCDIFT